MHVHPRWFLTKRILYVNPFRSSEFIGRLNEQIKRLSCAIASPTQLHTILVQIPKLIAFVPMRVTALRRNPTQLAGAWGLEGGDNQTVKREGGGGKITRQRDKWKALRACFPPQRTQDVQTKREKGSSGRVEM